jgi:hypothetical protein
MINYNENEDYELLEKIYQFAHKKDKDCFEKYIDIRLNALYTISEMLISVSKDHMSEKQFYEQVKRIIG